MSNPSGIYVQRSIVHVVAHLKPEECVFSKNELPLQLNARLRRYFEGQIANTLSDTAIRQAVFDIDSKEKSKAPEYCLEALDSASDFVESSRKLAEELLNAMGKDGRIRPERSSIAICLYTLSETKHLALLKLDPSEALIQKIEYDENMKPLWVNFEVREDAMPTSRERLQKAALILPLRSSQGHDLLLLDQQTSKDAADFFARKFLKAKPLFDAIKHTDLLYDSLLTAYNRLITNSILQPEQADALREQIGSVFKQRKITTSEWVKSLDMPESGKTIIRENIRRNLPFGEEFDLSPDYAQKTINTKRRIKGDYGVVVDVESLHWEDVVIEDNRKVIDGKTIRTLQIKITNAKEIIRK